MNDYSFNTVFGRTWGRAMTIPNATAAFRTTGIYPFNRTAVKTIDSVQTLHQSTGLHYIPVLSPAPTRRAVFDLSHISSNSDEDTLQPETGNESDDLQPHNLLLNEIEVPLTQSVFSHFYPNCQPEVHPPESYEKRCGRLLTGAEYMKELVEKDTKGNRKKNRREGEIQKETGKRTGKKGETSL